MVKKRLLFNTFVIVALFMLLMLVAGGCASQPVSEQNGTAGPEGEKSGPEGEVEIKFSTWHVPASAECADVWAPMLSQLETRSNGRIKTTPYFGGALGAGEEHYDIVADGLSDMGYFTASWTPGLFPLSDVLSMPVFVGGKDVAVDIGNAMLEKILYEEYPDVKMLNLNGCVQSYFWTTKPVHTLEDVKGLKMRTPGGLQTYMIEALGAEPVFMPLGDVYLSMETGVIDGIVTCPPLYYAFNLHEVADYAVVASFGCVAEGVAMNKDSWEGLPEDLQGIIGEVTENPFRLTGGLDVRAIDDIMEKLAGEGVKFYELPQQEAERWNEIFAEKVVRKWVDQMEKAGLPGRETLRMYKAELDKHGVAFPAYPKDL
jgi:TRAP-type C4-dicarboxylate transport system substrate-binding protein